MFLQRRGFSVKVLSCAMLFFIALAQTTVQAKTLKSHRGSSLFIAVGEEAEIAMTQTDTFSIGNPSLGKYKFFPELGKLIFKASKVGFTQINVRRKGKVIKSLQLYILSKREILKFAGLSQVFAGTTLSSELKGPYLHIRGTVRDIETYKLAMRVKKQFKKRILLEIKIHQELKEKIIEEVYTLFFRQQYHQIECNFIRHKLFCFYDSPTKLPKFYTNWITKDLAGNLLWSGRNKEGQIQISLKVYEIEASDQKNLTTGAQELQSTLAEVIRDGGESALLQNNIRLKEAGVNIYTFSKLKVSTLLGEKIKTQIGKELPFQQSQREGVSTVWKFIGIKQLLKVLKSGHRFQLSYDVQISSGGPNEIQGNRHEGKILISPLQWKKFYEADFKGKITSTSNLPLIGKIPLLKNLTQSQTNQEIFKRVFLMVKIKEY